ncbi:MAG: glycosyltransferase family 9 protein [Candidatus Marinimicrobia bacterium]|nr:glycosyltransferase family 9 protein [Candidatus Neomarinimicrobiota bacterium]MCF7830158.1 glycosyltransferase family 9 protein [Candidatus Neomarinimicrobiota bacterium]MCF7882108.1 glycosyltransferase family 9 protein [Candidatus Neomarinimicrobiota bacterium]
MDTITPSSLNRILLIRLSSIGDIVLTTPVLRTLHKKYPDLKIDFLIKEQFRDLIAYHPAVDNTITIPSDFSFRDLLNFRRDVQYSGKFDAIVDLHDNLRSQVLTFRSKIPYTRYDKQRFYRWLYVYWKIRTPAVEKYITERYFEAVEPFGVEDDGEGLDFCFPENFGFSDPGIANEVDAFRRADNPVTVAPGAAWATKKWPPERFGNVIQQLITNYNATVALLGGPAETDLAEQVISHVSESHRVFNFIGKTTLLESAKIIQHADLHLANDSGMTHIATAFRNKVLLILGSTAMPIVFYPKYTQFETVADTNLSCRPCTHMGRKRCPLGHFRCMKNIDESQVLDAYSRLTGEA